jgi:hypothetical protein
MLVQGDWAALANGPRVLGTVWGVTASIERGGSGISP